MNIVTCRQKSDIARPNVTQNLDPETVKSFGDEWSRHQQDNLDADELGNMWQVYFSIFPWGELPKNAVGFDMGAGTGRWAQLVAPKVGFLHVIDASADALNIARKNLIRFENITFHHASTETVNLPAYSCDFGYSLGVLHHIPDTQSAMTDCVRLLKPGAPFLVYLYYRFDNRPAWFKAIWQVSDLLRRVIYRLPAGPKSAVTDLLALLVYWPLSRLANMLEVMSVNPSWLPLSHYRHSSLTTLRTDSRDRFGTPLEQRFTKIEILEMMNKAGLDDIVFSEHEPFWVAVGRKQ